MLKKAIVVVSFGTSYENACKNGILPIEEAIKKEFFDFKVVRAFTSPRIRKKLLERDSIHIDSPAEAIERLMRSGYTNIIVQPTLIIPGIEYEKLIDLVNEYKGLSSSINVSIGKPLFHDDSDIKELANCVSSFYANIGDNTAIVLMGHGTDHFANSLYFKLLSYVRRMLKNFFITVVESEPSFNDVVEEVTKKGIEKVILKPLMIVAGDHAINDMASDESTSLKSLFIAKGIDCECVLEGIGGCSLVHKIYINHINAQIESLAQV